MRAVSVDELAREFGRPDVLFIDVEGYELEVLKGAVETLASASDCLVEVHQGCGLEEYGGTLDTLFGFFHPAVYDLYFSRQEGGEYEPLKAKADLPGTRFFLIALAR